MERESNACSVERLSNAYASCSATSFLDPNEHFSLSPISECFACMRLDHVARMVVTYCTRDGEVAPSQDCCAVHAPCTCSSSHLPHLSAGTLACIVGSPRLPWASEPMWPSSTLDSAPRHPQKLLFVTFLMLIYDLEPSQSCCPPRQVLRRFHFETSGQNA